MVRRGQLVPGLTVGSVTVGNGVYGAAVDGCVNTCTSAGTSTSTSHGASCLAASIRATTPVWHFCADRAGYLLAAAAAVATANVASRNCTRGGHVSTCDTDDCACGNHVVDRRGRAGGSSHGEWLVSAEVRPLHAVGVAGDPPPGMVLYRPGESRLQGAGGACPPHKVSPGEGHCSAAGHSCPA